MVADKRHKLPSHIGVLSYFPLDDRVIHHTRRQVVFGNASYGTGTALYALFHIQNHAIMHFIVSVSLYWSASHHATTNDSHSQRASGNLNKIPTANFFGHTANLHVVRYHADATYTIDELLNYRCRGKY